MSRIKCTLLGLMLIVIAGCSTAKKESAEEQPAAGQESAAQTEPQQPPATQEPATPAEPQQAQQNAAQRPSAPARSRPAATRDTSRAASQAAASQQSQPSTTRYNEAAPPAAVSRASEEPVQQRAPEPRYVTIPNGTDIQIRLQDPLDSSVNKTGDAFRGVLDKDIEVNGMVVAPRGSVVEGKLTNVEQSGRVEGRAAMSLDLVDLKIGQQSYPLQTGTLSFQAESTKKSDATKVGIGAGLGAVIGAIAGGGKGAAIGAAVGGGAGGATVLATRGKEIKFDAEQKFTFVLRKDVTVKLE